MKLQELIKELLKEGLYGDGYSYNPDSDSLTYSIQGFAKSGHGTLSEDRKGLIHLTTRYGQDDIVNSIEDVLDVAYHWDKAYCHKEDHDVYGIGHNWRKLYEKYDFDVSNLQ